MLDQNQASMDSSGASENQKLLNPSNGGNSRQGTTTNNNAAEDEELEIEFYGKNNGEKVAEDDDAVRISVSTLFIRWAIYIVGISQTHY